MLQTKGIIISVQSESIAPPFLFGIQHDLVGKGIGIASCDGRYVVLLSIHDRHNLYRRLLQHVLHRLPYFRTVCKASQSNHIQAFQLTIMHEPWSVFGVAMVTSKLQTSQHISSSPLLPPRPPNHALFRLRFSKN